MKVKLSLHARQRAAEMGVPTKEVKRALRNPEMTYHSKDYSSGSKVAVMGRLAIPFAQDGELREAITVLWHGEEGR